MRKYYTSVEIYELGKSIGVPISRSVLHWFRKEKLFMPYAIVLRFFIYKREDIVAMVKRLAESRNIIISEEQVNFELDRIAKEQPILTEIVEGK